MPFYYGGSVTNGRPLSTQDTVSRNTWTENITEGDRQREMAYRRKRLMKLYPELSLVDIEYYLRRVSR